MNNKRILEIISFINDGDKVIDVGCDHAYLSILLAKKNIPSIASDINEKIINKRKLEIKNNLISFYVSDGLMSIDDSLYNLPVIAGMGTKNALKIIKNSKRNFNKCIISTNGKYKNLRIGMKELGYIVECESVVKDNNRFYNVIVFIKGKKEYTNKELYIGINHKNKELLKEKNKYLLNKYNKIRNEIPKESEILNYLEYLK